MVTVYVPGAVSSETDTVRIAEPVPPEEMYMLEELKDAEGSDREMLADKLAGLTWAVRPTVPAKSLMLPSIIVHWPEEPIDTLSELGLAWTLKSTT